MEDSSGSSSRRISNDSTAYIDVEAMDDDPSIYIPVKRNALLILTFGILILISACVGISVEAFSRIRLSFSGIWVGAVDMLASLFCIILSLRLNYLFAFTCFLTCLVALFITIIGICFSIYEIVYFGYSASIIVLVCCICQISSLIAEVICSRQLLIIFAAFPIEMKMFQKSFGAFKDEQPEFNLDWFS
ncbi:unnamed protein product [Protopolystoma xenopodis]|uniref:Uncharacterized protein n=1 Tax=Protopolystoma xenopodis TaxID=117903 RepID=A0A3S5C7H1_9PLAT|nr:unnamed protein product [Protopolystoma xenopodis]